MSYLICFMVCYATEFFSIYLLTSIYLLSYIKITYNMLVSKYTLLHIRMNRSADESLFCSRIPDNSGSVCKAASTGADDRRRPAMAVDQSQNA